MSNGELLYLSLVLGVFLSFIVILAYGIIASSQARRARQGMVTVRETTAPQSYTPAPRQAA